MGIFDSIRDAIVRRRAQSAPPTRVPGQPTAKPPASPGPRAPSTGNGHTRTAEPVEVVDVEVVLTSLAAKNPQTLNWQTSIVDLMKLLDLDSSQAHRKELAKELGYTGDMNDSAAMNIWLHKQVMRKLGESGGKVPADLR